MFDGNRSYILDQETELKNFSYGLIRDPEVLVKCITSLSFPVHEIDLHQVLTFRAERYGQEN